MFKNRKYFFKQQEFVPGNIGYGQFSSVHFFLIGITALMIAGIVCFYVSSPASVRNTIRITIAVALISIDALKMTIIRLNHGLFVEYLPVEICSFAAYTIVFDTIFHGNSLLPPLLVTVFLPAAIMALIYPNSTQLPAFSFFTFHQFLYHGLIIAYILSCMIAKEIPMSYSNVWTSIAMISLIALVIYMIDIHFNQNYMFLVHPTTNSFLGEIEKRSGSGIRYTLALVGVCIIGIHVFYAIFKCVELFLL